MVNSNESSPILPGPTHGFESMRESLWDRKSKQSINAFLENIKNIYEELLQREMTERNKETKKIRHLQEVIGELEEINKNFQVKPYPPAYKPVCEGLDVLNRIRSHKPWGKCGDLLDFLVNHHHKLHWQYGYDNLPEGLLGHFAFGEILGSIAPVVSQKITLGFVLLSPDTDYPRHVHEGVDELYLNLGGACEINDQQVLHGESYHVISGLPHKIRSDKKDMGILLYTWVLSSKSSADYGMRFLDGISRD